MTTEQLEKIIDDYAIQNKEHKTLIMGPNGIQTIYWSEDENGNLKYDTETVDNLLTTETK